MIGFPGKVGEETDKVPTKISDRTCQKCADGTFNDQVGAKDCKGLTICPIGHEVDQLATLKTDRTCKRCAPKTWKEQKGLSRFQKLVSSFLPALHLRHSFCTRLSVVILVSRKLIV